MRVAAYCALSFRDVTRRAAGVSPLTCPPLSAETFWSVRVILQAAELIYLDLHGRPGERVWYGDHEIMALTADQVRSLRLAEAVVFAANCHAGDADSPMLQALLATGAGWVIVGEGPNYGPMTGPLYGVPLLGQWLRRCLTLGMGVPQALIAAKRIASLRGGARYVVDDLRGFVAYKGEKEQHGQA